MRSLIAKHILQKLGMSWRSALVGFIISTRGKQAITLDIIKNKCTLAIVMKAFYDLTIEGHRSPMTGFQDIDVSVQENAKFFLFELTTWADIQVFFSTNGNRRLQHHHAEPDAQMVVLMARELIRLTCLPIALVNKGTGEFNDLRRIKSLLVISGVMIENQVTEMVRG